MIPKCNKDMNVNNNTRTKKQIQIISSLNGNEQQWHCSEANKGIDVITDPMNTNTNLEEPIKSSVYSTLKYDEKTNMYEQCTISNYKGVEVSLKHNETSDEKYIDRTRFEEVRQKLLNFL